MEFDTYDIIHWILALFYLCLGVIPMFGILRRTDKKFSLKMAFHPFLLLGSIGRAIQMSLQPFVNEKSMVFPNGVNVLLEFIPSCIYFTAYLVILFIWTEIYYNTQQNGLELQQGRPIFLIVNVIMYFILLALIAANYIFFAPQQSDDISPIPQPLTIIEKIMQAYTGCLYILIAFGFLIYSFKIYQKFTGLLVHMTDERHRLVRKIQQITFLIVLCFIARAVIVFINIQYPFKDLWIEPVYYVVLEILPISTMIWILHSTQGTKQQNQSVESKPLLPNQPRVN